MGRVTASSTGISKAMDNMVVTVAIKVMDIKVVMAATSTMDKVATVATRAMDSRVAMVAIKAMAMRVTVATKAMAMRAMVATKAMATSLTRVMTKATVMINRDTANKAMASHRITGTKETMVATRAMDSKEATAETK